MAGIRASTQLCNSLFSSQPNSLFFPPPQSPFSFKKFHTNLSILSNQSHPKRTGFRAFAVKKRRRDKGGVLEKVGFKGSYEFEDQVVEDEDLDEDDEEGLLLPMEEMKHWFENRPAGFGQGKSYDTSVEDKLLDEIQQSRVAQLANINKLKHNPIPPGGVSKVPSKGGVSKEPAKASEVAPSGFRVRLLNLPKKKNIHRDLQIAFKEVPGIVSISPAVSGTKKTRDPICKGYGFVYFKTEEHAKRFIQVFSTESIAFGKIQKQIKCELSNPSSDDNSFGIPIPNTLAKSSLPVLSREDDLTTIIKRSKSSSKPSEDAESDESYESDDDDLIAGEYSDDSYESGDDIIAGKYADDSDESEDEIIIDDLQQILETKEPSSSTAKPQPASSAGKPFTSNKQETKLPPRKKAAPTKAKAPKLGSANKLKSKDKNMLTDVFSKYGTNAANLTSKNS